MLKNFFFKGDTNDTVLIIAGMHGSELSGIEVAHWLRVKLQSQLDKFQKRPQYNTFIVPELFPQSAKLARKCPIEPDGGKNAQESQKLKKEWDKLKMRDPKLYARCKLSEGESQPGREIVLDKGGTLYVIPPGRQFPPPGQPLSHLIKYGGPTDLAGNRLVMKAENKKEDKIPLLQEIRELLELIELIKPIRIASLHAHEPTSAQLGKDAPGIFVDPRYQYDKTLCQADPIDPTLINDFGTNPCKFSVDNDPAFPIISIKLLDDAVAKLAASDPSAINAIGLIESARTLYRESRDLKRKKAERKKKLGDSITKINEAANSLQIKPPHKRFDSARTIEGKLDDLLALNIAKNIDKGDAKKLIPGNHLNQHSTTPEVVHYSANVPPPDGFSLGDWGPVDVKSKSTPVAGSPVDAGVSATDPRIRDGVPVITVEVYNYPDSGAFDEDGVQLVGEDLKLLDPQHLPKKFGPAEMGRCKQLQAYADALIEKFLYN
jgi:hypothetical protein